MIRESPTIYPANNFVWRPTFPLQNRSLWTKWLIPTEWRGHFSTDKLLSLLAYSNRLSTRRTWLWVLLTPIPALIVALLIESIPLNDPLLGWRQNPTYFLRTWVGSTIISFAFDAQIELYIPEMRLPRKKLLFMNILQGGAMAASVLIVTCVAGVYPVPFVFALAAPIYVVCAWIFRFLFDYKRITDPSRAEQNEKIRRATPKVMSMASFSMVLVNSYCMFGAAFTCVPAHFQSPMTLVLLVIKSLATRREWRLAHSVTDGENDLANAQVSFGVHFFHVLFTSTCLQKSHSMATLAVVLLSGILQDMWAITALRRQAQRVSRASRLAHSCNSASSIHCIIQRLRSPHPACSMTQSPKHLLIRLASSVAIFHAQGSAVGPSVDSYNVCKQEPPTPRDVAYLESILSFYHCRETTLLHAYVDTFVPVIFLAYISAMRILPNGRYMPFLYTQGLVALAWRIGVQVVVKGAMLGLLIRVLDRRDKFAGPTGLQQLSFALERMATIVQIKCVLIVFNVFNFSLVHNGNDLTFKFKWLSQPQHV